MAGSGGSRRGRLPAARRRALEEAFQGLKIVSEQFCMSDRARARGRAGKVRLVGFDASLDLQQGLRDGVIDAQIVQDPFFMGFCGVETILQKLRGETPEKRIDSPPQAVFKADLDTPEVQKLLNPDLESYL